MTVKELITFLQKDNINPEAIVRFWDYADLREVSFSEIDIKVEDKVILFD